MFNQNLVLVSKKLESVAIETEKGEKKNITSDVFLMGWNEVIIAIEANDKKQNLDNSIIDFKWMLYSLPIIALVIISLSYNNFNITSFLQLLLSISGFILGVGVILEKIGIKNELVTKFCSINQNSACDSIIKSDKSKINSWLDFSDLPILFFGISIFSIFLSPTLSIIVGGLSLLSIPFIGYSIWLQKFSFQKWCLLCLSIATIILLQEIAFCFSDVKLDHFISINKFELLFSGVLFCSVWFFSKPLLMKNVYEKKQLTDLKKLKRNYSVFKGLTKEIYFLDGFEKLKGICFGNEKAHVQLTIILSPSCGFCHASFQKAYELALKYPNVFFVNILFNVNPENDNNPYKYVIQSLLTINNQNVERARKAIVDWHIERLELEEWKEKWMVDHIDTLANEQLQQQYNWCVVNKFNYTPVKIINNRLFPNEYEIEELKYFLNDFSDEREVFEEIVSI